MQSRDDAHEALLDEVLRLILLQSECQRLVMTTVMTEREGALPT